MQQVTKSI